MPADIPSIIARADQIGAQKSALADQATDQAISLAESIVVPRLTFDSLEYSPSAPPGAGDASGNVSAQFQAVRTQLLAEMQTQFEGFFASHFPVGGELSDALDWVSQAITTGGSGINVNVENALWDRARAKLLRDSARTEDEAMTTWAARRYTLPPGAAVNQLAQIRTATMGAVADVGRDVAIEGFKAELENIRLAVTTAVQARAAAMSAAADYIRTLALGPQVGVSFAGQIASTSMKAQEMLATMFDLQLTGDKLRVDALSQNARIELDANALSLKGNVDKASLAVQAAMAAAQSAGTQAAAALNAVHAQVGWNLNDSRDLTGTF